MRDGRLSSVLLDLDGTTRPGSFDGRPSVACPVGFIDGAFVAVVSVPMTVSVFYGPGSASLKGQYKVRQPTVEQEQSDDI